MITPDEREHFLDQGYLHVEGVLEGTHLTRLQHAFDEVWSKEGGETSRKVRMHEVLKYQEFIALIEHPPILERHRAIFSDQVQLSAIDLLRQGPHAPFPERSWHRDFVFPGDRPLAINTIVFVDDVDLSKGPTRIVPRTHRGEQSVPPDKINTPLEGEVAVPVRAGSAIFINSAIWHTGGRNCSDGLRRGIYMYYSYWWLKQYDVCDSGQGVPWQALEGATAERLQLLGLKMPARDLHLYDS